MRACVRASVCVWVCVGMCVCLYAWISVSIRSILTGEFSFSSFSLCLRVKNPFFDWADAFLFYFEFSMFSKFIFDFFLMIGSRYLNRMGSI